MITRTTLLGLAAGAVLLTGCTIHQRVDPAKLSPALAPEICMIAASGVRAGFTNTYRATLQNKGFRVRELPAGAGPSLCPLSTTYTGTWKWDLALYMSYAQMGVFHHGVQVGVAIYDARGGGGRLDKFIDAESKIHELADQLFPNGAAGLGLPVDAIPAAQTEQRLEALRQELRQQKLSYEEYRRRHRELMQEAAER
ncbi:MAG: Sbal_3080 family lipoprotein [Pseudomonas sp.]